LTKLQTKLSWLLFMAHGVYTADLLSLIESTGLTPRAYADDTQMGTNV